MGRRTACSSFIMAKSWRETECGISTRRSPVEIVVFWEDSFPSIDTRPVALDALHAAFTAGQTPRFLSADDLPAALEAHPDLFVNPYGSAFPKSAWPAFTAYLRRGGNWANLGGAP